MENETKQAVVKTNNGFVTIIIFLVGLLLSGGIGFFYGAKYMDSGNNKCGVSYTEEDKEKEEAEKPVPVTEVKEGLTKSELVMISNYIIDNALDYANIGSNEGNQNIYNNLNNINLLNNSAFKFVFAFTYGMKLDSTKYQYDVFFNNGVEEEVSGSSSITMQDYQLIYNKIFGTDYVGSLPINVNEEDYVIANSKVYGTTYTGYTSLVDFKLTESDINKGEIEKDIVKEEDQSVVGTLKITFDENSNGTVNLTGLYLNAK